MLAGKAPDDLADLTYPVLCSPKLDGIRALVVNGVVMSRSGKPIPNKAVQKRFGRPEYEGFDGELIYGPCGPAHKDAFRITTSVVMAPNKPEGQYVDFWVFDVVSEEPFDARMRQLTQMFAGEAGPGLRHVANHNCSGPKTVESLEESYTDAGFEGLMIRSVDGPYKHGRSTTKEGYLLKLKRFEDAEARIVGMVEEMENTNVATKDAFGRTERSSHKAGMVGKGRLGAFSVVGINGPFAGITFEIGSGYSAEERVGLWALGPTDRIVKYRFFPLGSKDKPRFPTFLGFRAPEDMSS